MKLFNSWPRISLAVLALGFGVQLADAQGTVFTYQGRLNFGSNAVNGSYDLTFTLFPTNTGGTSVGKSLTNSATALTNGLFTVPLDFGPGIFTGNSYWLEIGARTNGAPGFSTLAPRQQLTPSPYAIFANTSSNVSGTISASQIGGIIPLAQLPGSLVTSNDPSQVSLTGTFSGNGAGLSGVNAASLNGLSAANFWKIQGDAGTTAGLDFVGTTDFQPLELHVNGQRALVLQPTTNDLYHTAMPNLLGGSSVNAINPSSYASVIGGGGAANYYGNVYSNGIWGSFAFLGGGLNNSIQDGSDGSFVGSGFSNSITGSFDCVLVGGFGNSIQFQANESFIGGGIMNAIAGYSSYASIAGGYSNLIGLNDNASVIGGGQQNTIQQGAALATIGGGNLNTVEANAIGSTIVGGLLNSAQGNYETIGGGFANVGFADYVTVSGGQSNECFSDLGFIGGGFGNYIDGVVTQAAIGGGYNNEILEGSSSSFIGGGYGNFIYTFSPYSTISGGTNNSIQANDIGSTIGGGVNNAIGLGAYYSTLGGGVNNIVNGAGSTVPGGNGNMASGVNSFAAGTFAYATNNGSFVLTDQQYVPFYSAFDNTFNARFSGGYRFITGGGVIFSAGGIGANQTVGWGPGNGSWTFSSDRNLKDRFKEVDPKSVLEKVSQLPISEWSYKGYDQRHIGAIAQDFHALFPLNDDDKGLNEVDLHGVELAAIKGLNQKLEEKDAKIQALEKRLEKMEERLGRHDDAP